MIGFPDWVSTHYARIRENKNTCDMPDCICHWVDSLNSRPKQQPSDEWMKK